MGGYVGTRRELRLERNLLNCGPFFHISIPHETDTELTRVTLRALYLDVQLGRKAAAQEEVNEHALAVVPRVKTLEQGTLNMLAVLVHFETH